MIFLEDFVVAVAVENSKDICYIVGWMILIAPENLWENTTRNGGKCEKMWKYILFREFGEKSTLKAENTYF